MNILFIPTKDPRLTNGGNEQRTNLLWDALKKEGKVYTILPDSSLNVKEEYIDGSSPIYKFKLNVKRKLSFGRLLNSILIRTTLVNKWAYLTLTDKKLPNPYRNIKFDAVVTRYVFSSCFWDFSIIAPTYIDIDDYPVQVYETRYRQRIPAVIRCLTDWLVQYQVKCILKKACGGWIANKSQISRLDKNFSYLPNIPLLPSNKYKANEPSREYLFTIGNMAYEPNYLGVDRFLSEIWPIFHTKYPKISFLIAGSKAPKEFAERWNAIDGVKYAGFVDDIEEAYSHCIATVVPIYAGGGTCIKTLESLAYSRVCIASPFGARGLDVQNAPDNGLMVFYNAFEFIDCFNSCMNINTRTELEKSASRYILERFSKATFQRSVNMVINNKA